MGFGYFGYLDIKSLGSIHKDYQNIRCLREKQEFADTV